MATGPKTQEGRDLIAAANRRRWQAWRAANGRQVRATGNPAQDQLLNLLASLSPTDRFLREAMKPAQTPWTTNADGRRFPKRDQRRVKRRPS